MGALDQARVNNIIDATHGTAAFVAPTTPMKLRWMTAVGSATANGTELGTGGGYTAGSGATVTMAAASGGSASSNAAATTTNMPASTIAGVEEWDSNGTPKRWWQGALTASKVVNAGDTLTIPSGSYSTAMP